MIMKRIEFILYLLVVISSSFPLCAQEVKHIKTRSYEGYLFPEDHPIHGFPRIGGCDLSAEQIQKAEEILAAHFIEIKGLCHHNEVINKCSLKTYKRQYWGSIDERGHVIVNMELIKKSLAKQIQLEDRKDIVSFCDGGCDIIDVTVDLNDGTYHIAPNGYA